MKIDLWHNALWARYKGAVFSELYTLCQAQGVSLRVFQMVKTDSLQSKLVPIDLSIHRYPYELLFDDNFGAVPKWKMVVEGTRRVAASDADLIVLAGYARPEYLTQLLVARARGKKVAVFCDSTSYDRPGGGAKDLVKKAFFSLCHGVFCYGERASEYVRSHGVPPERIFIRVQSTPPIVEMPAAAILARRRAMAGRPPRFVYVGRLAAEKNLDLLMDGFVRFREAHPQARLTIVGAGPMGETLAARVAAQGLGDSIELTGPQSGAALADILLDASALVLPSVSEPWGLVVNEALALGVPVIVSYRCGCVPELVIEGRTGFVFDSARADDLAAKMTAFVPWFAEPEAVARTCIDHIAPFNAVTSARGILDGCRAIMADGRPASATKRAA